MELVYDIGLLIMLAGVGAFIARIFKQPMVPAYIISGVILGNILGAGTENEVVSAISELAVTFLLFMVGLELNLKKIKNLGLKSAIAGTVQTGITFAAGFLIARYLGMSITEQYIVGLVLTLSSTMIVVKLLSDKREINTLHGRMAIGILIIQDIVAVFSLSYLSAMHTGIVISPITVLLKIGLLIAVGLIASKYVFPTIFEFAAKSQELLLGMSLAVCFTFGLLANLAGTSMAIGAFFAGVLLANLPYNIEILGKVTTLRDFFAILFFTALGVQLNINNITNVLVNTAIITVMVIILKPLIIYSILRLLKYTPKTSFLTSTSLSQVSGFSLILVAFALNFGVVGPDMLTMTILLAVITMSTSSYFMKFEIKIYSVWHKMTTALGFKHRKEEKKKHKKLDADIILAGYDRIGYSILKSIQNKDENVVVVDFNPDIIKKLAKTNIKSIYGDITDPEILHRLNLKKVKMVISTANKFEDNLLLLKRVKAENTYAPTIVTAYKIEEALELYKQGADYVILPHFLGGDMVSRILPEFRSDQVKMAMRKYKHISDLLARKDLGQEHPQRQD